MDLYRTGWAIRPRANAVLCVLEMARIHAERGEIEPIRTILKEADEFFGAPGNGFDGFFYNEIAGLSALPSLSAYSDELRDHALQSLVKRLGAAVTDRGSPPVPALVSELLGRSRLWPAGVVSDAEFAARRAGGQARERSHNRDSELFVSGIQVGRGSVTAVCRASETGQVLLGFDSGQVYAYRPRRKEVVCVTDDLGPLLGLAVAGDGRTIAALHGEDNKGQIILTRLRQHPDGSYRASGYTPVSTNPACWLTPILSSGTETFVGCGDGAYLSIVDLTTGAIRCSWRIADDEAPLPSSAILLPTGCLSGIVERDVMVFTHDGPNWCVIDSAGTRLPTARHHWEPAPLKTGSLHAMPIFTRFASPFLELIGFDQEGAVHVASFHVEDADVMLLRSHVVATPGGYLAAEQTSLFELIAVSATAIDRVSYPGEKIRRVEHLELGFPTAIACFALTSTAEILVVCSDGVISRVATTRRARTASK